MNHRSDRTAPDPWRRLLKERDRALLNHPDSPFLLGPYHLRRHAVRHFLHVVCLRSIARREGLRTVYGVSTQRNCVGKLL